MPLRWNSNAEKRSRGISIELLSMLYLVSYVPYATLTRWLATIPYAPLGRALTGLEVLPAITILAGLMTYSFIWASGWWREAHRGRLMGFTLPRPTRWTLLSGVGAALLLFTVPLSFTFRNVSIPFMQLLMRGDVLLVAPLVDFLLGRRVRWYSWLALSLVAAGLSITINARGGLYLPPLAILTIVLYTFGYLVRIYAMTRVAKTGDPRATKGYFVEEQLVAIPLALAALAVLSLIHLGVQGDQLRFGFVTIWSSGRVPYFLVLAALLFLISIFAILILLNPRENTFCVPFERSASVLAGLTATYLLAAMALSPPPSHAEVAGAALLVFAIVLLSLAPRLAPSARPRANAAGDASA
jgi:drug/metabolite transporter (DMT)-like permease